MDCQQATELLPWLINGSLTEAEERPLREHLLSCESCCGELHETVRAGQLFDEHIPSLALAEYAQDLPNEEYDREIIARHLAGCPSCRQEVEWVKAADRAADFGMPPAAATGVHRSSRNHSPSGWQRRLALVAGVAAVLGCGGLFWTIATTGPPSDLGTRASVTPPAAPRTTAVDVQQRSPDALVATDELFVDGFESGSMKAWSRQLQAAPVLDSDPSPTRNTRAET